MPSIALQHSTTKHNWYEEKRKNSLYFNLINQNSSWELNELILCQGVKLTNWIVGGSKIHVACPLWLKLVRQSFYFDLGLNLAFFFTWRSILSLSNRFRQKQTTYCFLPAYNSKKKSIFCCYCFFLRFGFILILSCRPIPFGLLSFPVRFYLRASAIWGLVSMRLDLCSC